MARSQKRKKEVLEVDQSELVKDTAEVREAPPAPSASRQTPYEEHIEGTAESIGAEEKPRKRRKTTAKAEPKQLPTIPVKPSESGRVYVCGQGDSGQLGLGNLIPDNDEDEDLDDPSEIKLPRHSPVDEQDSPVAQVAAGGMHSIALTTDGRVFTSGVNDEAALGRCTDAAIWEEDRQAGAMSQDAYKWGQVKMPTDHGKVVQVSAGDSHSTALTELGAVWCWGLFRGNSGPYGFAPGVPHALRPTLVYKPTKSSDQVVAVSSGADHVLALRRDGSVLSWGYGEQGQLGRLGSRLRNPEKSMLEPAEVHFLKIKGYRKRFKAASVTAGSFGSFVTSADGVTVAFGVNASGQLGLDIQGERVESNIFQAPTRVNALESAMAEGEHVTHIGAGKSHTLALTSTGRVLSFGLQTYGRLGRADADSSSDGSLPPGRVLLKDDESPATVISAGHDTSALITEGKSLYTWGMGTNYQLCRKSDNDVSAPWKVKYDRFEPTSSAVKRVHQIAFGGQHALLIAE